MNNQLQSFNFGNKTVRMQIIDEKEYFCASDVCKILAIQNGRDALSRIESEDVVLTDAHTAGGTQKMSFVNEAGLYGLIFQSKKKEAKNFRKWIFEEILPQIRKTGQYSLIDQKTIITADFLLDIAHKMKALEIKNAELEIENKINNVLFNVPNKENNLTRLQESAVRLGLKPNKFIERLRILGYLKPKSGKTTDRPYQEYISKGYFALRTHLIGDDDNKKEVVQTYITLEGRKYLFRKLSKNFADITIRRIKEIF